MGAAAVSDYLQEAEIKSLRPCSGCRPRTLEDLTTSASTSVSPPLPLVLQPARLHRFFLFEWITEFCFYFNPSPPVASTSSSLHSVGHGSDCFIFSAILPSFSLAQSNGQVWHPTYALAFVISSTIFLSFLSDFYFVRFLGRAFLLGGGVGISFFFSTYQQLDMSPRC